MKSKFYQISQENFEIMLKFYQSINKKIKKSYNNLIKYRKVTDEYCSKIQKIFRIRQFEYLLFCQEKSI